MKISTVDMWERKIHGIIDKSDTGPMGKKQSNHGLLSICGELRKRLTAEEAGGEAVITFKCKGGTWPLTAALLNAYEEMFFDMDVRHELNTAVLWCDANPSKRKTKVGMERFLNAWLSRSNDKGRYRKRDDAIPEGEPRNASKEDLMLAYDLTEEEAEKRMSE